MSPRTRNHNLDTPCEAISFNWEGSSGDDYRPHYSASIHADPECPVLVIDSAPYGHSGMAAVFLANTHFASTFSEWFAEADGFDGEIVIDPVEKCGRCWGESGQVSAPVQRAADAADDTEGVATATQDPQEDTMFRTSLPHNPPQSSARPAAPAKPATPKQMEFLRKLFGERQGSQEAQALRTALLTEWKAGTLTSKLASATIDHLLEHVAKDEAPQAAAPQPTGYRVPEGRYALHTAEGHLAFYGVDYGKGKWEGRTFVVQLVGAPGEFTEQKLSRDRQADLLAQLGTVEAAQAAATAFARHYRVCGRCLADLSKLQSRAAGYGSTCASKAGFWYPTRAEALAITGEADTGQA